MTPLFAKLQQRAAEGRPIRVGLIGAGKFGSMYLAQVPRTPGIHLAGIADLSPEAACRNLARVGWEAERVQAPSLDAALADGRTHVGTDWQALVRTRRSTSTSSAPATRSPRSTTAWRPLPTASTSST
jgi:predicted homoserine dehydrogenase-like protein